MGRLVQIISGVGILIGMYLVIANADKTSKVISTIGGQSNAAIKTLQGR